MSFNVICQKLIDAWLSTDAQEAIKPEAIYSGILSSLTVRMRLSVIYLEGDEPRNWVLQPVRQTRIASRIIDLNKLFSAGRLGDIKDQAYVETAVLPAYTKAIELSQPLIDTVETRLLGIRVIYDRIILPQKGLKPRWLVVCTNGKFMTGAPISSLQVDAVDQAILLALIEGMTAKEMGVEIGLSARTVEHRLERMKKQTGARSLAHLAALFVAAGFDGSIHHREDVSKG